MHQRWQRSMACHVDASQLAAAAATGRWAPQLVAGLGIPSLITALAAERHCRHTESLQSTAVQWGNQGQVSQGHGSHVRSPVGPTVALPLLLTLGKSSSYMCGTLFLVFCLEPEGRPFEEDSNLSRTRFWVACLVFQSVRSKTGILQESGLIPCVALTNLKPCGCRSATRCAACRQSGSAQQGGQAFFWRLKKPGKS